MIVSNSTLLCKSKKSNGVAGLRNKKMKKKVLVLIMALASVGLWNDVFAQFSSDRVLVYVKAGQEPSKATDVWVIGYFADRNEIANYGTDASRIRKIISSHSRYFKSPYNLPEDEATLFPTFWSPRICSYNPSVSTSKYRVYSGHLPAGSNCWGSWDARTTNWAFSKDGKQLILWHSGREDNRTTYLLTELSEFDPSTSSSSNYDFLE